MKFLILTLFVCLLVIAIVSAVPADESVLGDIYGQDDHYSPQDQQSFLKLKKLKKLLFKG